jgi:hypothetical protein
MTELEKLGKELESVKARLRALELAAGFEQPPREKVTSRGHDSSQDQE